MTSTSVTVWRVSAFTLFGVQNFNNSTDILDPRDVEVASMAMACVFGHPFEIFPEILISDSQDQHRTLELV